VIPLKDDAPAGRTPLVTFALLAANLTAFGWQVLAVGLETSIRRGGAIPYEVLTFQDVEWRAVVPPPLTVLTSMFLHGGVGHLAMNMLTLWIFGNAVERALGPISFAGLYLVAGVLAALAQTLAAAASGDVLVPMVGASGAISGVLAAFLLLFPHARVARAPASVLIVVWFAVQVLAIVFGGDPGVAFVAHVGGFVAGYLLVRMWVRESSGG
jgi:membrane associated rhomboid family serine protease